jgi:hypothetical protein
MDRDSYSQPELARFVNDYFVAIKFDYDLQPEIAARPQQAQAFMNLPVGLPLKAFLSPSAKLYFGGGHFPPLASAERARKRRTASGTRRRGAKNVCAKNHHPSENSLGDEFGFCVRRSHSTAVDLETLSRPAHLIVCIHSREKARGSRGELWKQSCGE